MIILKILLIIILSLFTLIAILLLLNIHLYAEFKQELNLYIRILFIKIRLLPEKDKKVKTKSKNKAKKEKNIADDKPKKSLLDKIKEQGISNFLSLLKELLNLVKNTIFPLLCKIKVKNIAIDVSVSCDDAAQTAIMYGEYCAVAYPLVSIIATNTNCAKYNISIIPNFDDNAQTEINASLDCKCRIIWILIYGIKFLIGFSKIDK